MLSDFDSGMTHGKRSLEFAEESGSVGAQAACLGNLGNLLYLIGRFDEAVDYHQRAISFLQPGGHTYSGSLESLARIRLAQGRIEDSGHLLNRVEETIQAKEDRALYSYRYALLTRVQLLARQGAVDESLATTDSILKIADSSGDHLLSTQALLTKAELLQQANRIHESLPILNELVGSLATYPPDLYAHYERILACGLASLGDLDAARSHFDRAKRIYDSIRSAPGLLDLDRCWHAATQSPPTAAPIGVSHQGSPGHAQSRTRSAQQALHSAASLMLHVDRPELLAREIIQLLDDTDCVLHATVRACAKDGQSDVLATIAHREAASTDEGTQRRLSIGLARDRAIDIVVTPRPDIESLATLNAVALMLRAIHDLERARAEREERMSLWPPDEDAVETGAVARGQMRDLMSYAKRVATTNVSVLITGESGTGKEILARAIHHFSDRASKPFIPFNCTAVPREMLESQLFGHRRGAFTGADREHLGFVRSAHNGTLFLDEIGELGLDLQPKLLRFLESGEICPLGESTPFSVNVRIVAATNSNLEELMQDGRFREDLFYRLNVIRLRIPSLRERRDEIPSLVNHFVARFAAEFNKGNVRIAEDTMEHLLVSRWPGNIRQLQNEVRRMVALAEPKAVLTPDQLSDEIVNTRLAARSSHGECEMVVPLKDKLAPTVSKIEREMIRLALRDHHGKVEAVANALGISRKGLYLKRQRLGL